MLLTLSILSLASFCIVRAQGSSGGPAADPFSIANIRWEFPGGNVTSGAPVVFRWNLDGNLKNVESRNSIEIVRGENVDTNGDVVDILEYNSTTPQYDVFFSSADPEYLTKFDFPLLLPGGRYHLRLNHTLRRFTYDPSSDEDLPSRIYSGENIPLTARTQSFSVVRDDSCNAGIPRENAHPPPTIIPTPTSSNFTSFTFRSPDASSFIQPSSLPQLQVSWAWRNTGNYGHLGDDKQKFWPGGITELKFQLQTFPDLTNVGEPIVPPGWNDTPRQTNDFKHDFSRDAKVNTTYVLLATYKNALQDGAVTPGKTVNTRSGPFSVVSGSNQLRSCDPAPPRSNTDGALALDVRHGLAIMLALSIGLSLL